MKIQELPIRKRTRLKDYDYSTPSAYFITICTENRKSLFWNGDIDITEFHWNAVGANCVRPQNLPLSNIGKIVDSELQIWHTAYENVSLHSYVVMPNHLHIILVITGTEDGRTQFAPTVRPEDFLSIRGADRNEICPGGGIIVILNANRFAFR